jgi:beta-lactamase class A
MNFAQIRHTFSLLAVILPFLTGTAVAANKAPSAKTQLEKIERGFHGRIGVFALDTSSGKQWGYRASERFAFCSTFKMVAVGAILAKSERVPDLLQKRIKYDRSNLVAHCPITEKHLSDGMTVVELSAAALQYSDNLAGNLLLRELGGPAALTKFARSLGDTQFRLDRWETALNTAIPGDLRDTSTPQAMARTFQLLVLGNALTPPNRKQLITWMIGNTTGAERIHAGIPANWKIGDKTGTGDYGAANDIAIVWPPNHKPIIIAIYTTQSKKDAAARSDVIAAATKDVVGWLRAN